MTLTETQSFFGAYRDAFNRFDGDAVADLWHERSAISSSAAGGVAQLTWWSEDAPMRDNHRALCEVYRRSGLSRADFTIEQHVPMGADHAFAHLRWTLWRADGSVLQQFHTGYQLLRTAQGLKVLLAVAHEERLSAMSAHAGH